MKTFPQFISECYFLLFEAPKPPDYNYEEAFVRLYNYLTGSEDKKNRVGKQMRGLIQRSAGDSAGAADVMNDIVSLIAREVAKAEKDPNHPLHFNNIPDIGFNRGGKTSEHQSAYYEKLNGQKYTFLNLIGSKSGRSMGAKGLIAVRAGSEKTPLSSRGEKVYGKSSDTSKADVLFKDNSGEVIHTSSLKDVGGSVFASSGPEETKGNLLMGMYTSLDSRLEKKEINQNEYDELVERGTQLASEIALKMTTKGLSKEEEKNIINPEIDSRGLFKTMGDFEDSFPGVSEYVAKEQITGKGKYGQGVDSVLKTNRGGELIEFPEFLSTFVNQRFRTSKHGEKGNVSVAADAQKVDPDVERPEADAESMYNITASRSQIERKKQGDKIIADLQSGKSKTLDQFQQDAQAATAPAPIDPKAEAQQAAEAQAQQAPIDPAAEAQAQAELTQAEKAKERAEKIIGPGGKRVLRQHVGTFLANNPDKAQQRSLKISAAQQNIDASTANINSIQQQKADAQAALTPEQPQPSTPEQVPPEQQQQQAPPPEQVPPEQQQQQASPPQEQVPPEEQKIQPEKKPKKKGKVEPENVEQTTDPVA